ncbi:MAG: hypothetical protein LJE96_13570 [Deltaproteobacteria bacterium]|nr:hypothetical protein [Deltaproteobacteria bacterium]
MDLFDTFSILITFSALFGYLNYRFFHLPRTIGLMLILKTIKAPKALEPQMAGEAFFNDGVVVAIFIVLLKLAIGNRDAGFAQAAFLFVEEAMGGILLGLCAGYLAYQMLKRVDNYQVEVWNDPYGHLYGRYFLGDGPGTDH